ncbi:unnamed protein product [Rotaria sp. Silwood1]|nr:unnamed protein product [Rotaria sp. Silwood1]CAF1260092.1 unnamed protein product [Rotaria sp. Silwood1]CAF3379520.1 unnamed protein product [Rotaria sp. Silwood1]CAF3498262.1 unnamed protein product [Rotaria sp. Silwood1]CAF3530374.1 unnamed protein product [Rotaria sp. Silwood1]
MQPEKRKTIKSFFLPDNKKTRNEEQQETTVLDSPSSSQNPCSDSPDHTHSASSSLIVETTDITPVSQNSGNKSMPEDISKSCNDHPRQPKLRSYPSNFQNCSFQSNWFVNRNWLEYSVKNDRIYCFNCRHFRSYKTNIGDAFTTCGYNNCKDALESGSGLHKHEQSQAHVIATKNLESFKLRQQLQLSVINSLDNSRSILVRRNRDRLIKISSTLLLLARQMIAFRGHQENEK